MSPRQQLAQQIHQSVDTQFPYATDEQVWHESEHWEPISTAGRGDCEDFVLEKRARLLAAGVPPGDLRIATVNVPLPSGGNDGHAVLVIKDGDKDWVSDQRQSGLITADEMKGLGYEPDRIQVPGQFMWAKWAI